MLLKHPVASNVSDGTGCL